MSRTITAMFDSRHDAEAGRQRLLDAKVDADNVRIHDQSSAGYRGDGDYSSHQDRGVWDSIKNAFMPDEDRHTYEEGIRRGGYVLSADVDEDEVDEAVRALEEANGIDIDERAGQWRSQGWNYGAGAAAGGAASATGGYDRNDRPAGSMGSDNEEHLDVIEEQLVVGKREVDRGGVRVRSYVTEKPVHEQVRLREEHVSVERHPVDRPIDSSDAFRERTVEMTATGEEAVVGKTARVVEEVVVHKDVDTRTQDIDETVRRQDVEVEQLSGSERTGTGTGTGTGMGASVSDKAAGLGQEAIGNVKQGLGSMTGNEDLRRSGEAQERDGEMRQGKTPDRY